MKKTCLVILVVVVLFICTGCNIDNFSTDFQENKETSSDAIITLEESSDSATDIVADNTERHSDAADNEEPKGASLTERVMTEIEGEYVSSLFAEELRKTKSALKASKYPESVAIRIENGSFYTLIGNGHEGMPVGDVENLEYSDGKYIISFCGYEGNNLKIEYTPEKKSVCCESISDEESWSTDGKMIEFIKTSDRNGETPHLAKVLFEGISNVDILDDGVYANVYEKKYKISVITDYMGEAAFNNYSGGLYLSCEDSSLIMRYKYENGKIYLYDTDNMLVTTFE